MIIVRAAESAEEALADGRMRCPRRGCGDTLERCWVLLSPCGHSSGSTPAGAFSRRPAEPFNGPAHRRAPGIACPAPPVTMNTNISPHAVTVKHHHVSMHSNYRLFVLTESDALILILSAGQHTVRVKVARRCRDWLGLRPTLFIYDGVTSLHLGPSGPIDPPADDGFEVS